MKKDIDKLLDIFHQTFFKKYNTLLIGGAKEPLYKPAQTVESSHIIYFRDTFFSSALHEIAHWCIAGSKRRRQVDYGYFYVEGSRSFEEQLRFQQHEVKPQALEWIFTETCGLKFTPSIDNFSNDIPEENTQDFSRALLKQKSSFMQHGLPNRAEMFYSALKRNYLASTDVILYAEPSTARLFSRLV